MVMVIIMILQVLVSGLCNLRFGAMDGFVPKA